MIRWIVFNMMIIQFALAMFLEGLQVQLFFSLMEHLLIIGSVESSVSVLHQFSTVTVQGDRPVYNLRIDLYLSI